MKRVVVIGGGIAGLSAAYYLRGSGAEVTVLEGSDRFGGKIGTEQIGPYLVEQGPDSVFTVKPAAVELAVELGMESELVEPLQHDFSILVNGKLFHVPRALASLMPGASTALEKAEFLGHSARKRILREKEIAPGSGEDESIASFFRRRFGRRFSNLLAEPLLAGIHGGDPERLSMLALYPTYLGLEQRKGSLTAPSEHPQPSPNAIGRKPGFLALRGGMESLVDRVRESLNGAIVKSGARAVRVDLAPEGFRIHQDRGAAIDADILVLAIPSYVSAQLLQDALPKASEQLVRIRHTSTAVATLAHDGAAFPKPLHGNGFLVPYTEKSALTGCTWSSNKWPNRAPEGTTLIRCFIGRDGGLNVDDYSDEELSRIAEGEIQRILMPKAAPVLSILKRWTRAMPQKEVGHTDLLARIDAAIEGLPIHLIGASYRSSGIPDCVRDGREAAARIRVQMEDSGKPNP